MLRRQSDLIVGIILALILVGIDQVEGVLPIIRAILTIPIVLYVPGNALVSIIFTQSKPRFWERMVYSLGSSLALVILGGLLLGLTPWGLESASWSVMMAVITLLLSGLAIWQRWNIPLVKPSPPQRRLPVHQAILLGMAVLVVTSAIKLTYSPRLPENIQGYTTLWIDPSPQAQPDSLNFGIHSQELGTTAYLLILTFNGQTLYRWTNITLEPGMQFQETVKMPVGKGRVELALYRTDDPGVIYRQVSIMISH